MFFGSLENDGIVFLIAFLLACGVFAAKFSNRIGLPSLVLFILFGMLIGSDGLGFIYFDDAEMAQAIGILALIIILFEGGLETKWQTVRSVALPSLLLATVGVLITSIITGIAVHYILDVEWYEGLLFGAIVGSTDAAAVFAALKERNIKAKIGATLEAESGTNDPMAVFLTLIFIELILQPDTSFWMMLPSFFWQMGIGLILGLGIGKLATIAINRINLESSGLYPIFTLSFGLITYSVASFIDASGFLAVYVAALVIGNSELTYRYSISQFNEGFAWIAQILMFVILGLLAFPEHVFSINVMTQGLFISIVLIFVARPIAVFLSLIKMNYSIKEKIFISWAGLRGAVPIVLATFPIVSGLEGAVLFFNLIFFVVLTSALVQGSSISNVAAKLGLIGPVKDTPHHSIELISIAKANAEMVQFQANRENAVVGQTLKDIEFPKHVTISAIVRGDRLITPYGDTEIKAGDFLYILVSRKYKEELRKMLNRKKKPGKA
ncbi:potassium/proton antiporter [Tenuibacillus multivorans]|uniref:Cell volume regulation protein A n=1 Tax=Tenuibacillus multivorans TaxID=237069 RepID=A0A1H0G2N1_9BACI|nr:potassium/proton antiporter [Tenuibacillus multivorans]GEL78105.1 K+/H+ antiporter [Tenuibacillus multivorans]SDO01146.1 cell volume regulation protein A [Tenuibacillus multivorans]